MGKKAFKPLFVGVHIYTPICLYGREEGVFKPLFDSLSQYSNLISCKSDDTNTIKDYSIRLYIREEGALKPLFIRVHGVVIRSRWDRGGVHFLNTTPLYSVTDPVTIHLVTSYNRDIPI